MRPGNDCQDGRGGDIVEVVVVGAVTKDCVIIVIGEVVDGTVVITSELETLEAEATCAVPTLSKDPAVGIVEVVILQ